MSERIREQDVPPNAEPMVLSNDFGRHWAAVHERVLEAVRRVGESGWYILGREVEAFEAALSEFMGVRLAVGCASGLDAIELGLRALGLRAGDAVLTTPLSAFATTLAIVRCGGRPIFVDVDASGLIDLARCREVLRSDRTIRFLVPVHLYGHSLDLTALEGLAKEFEVTVVEDCAQAIGAKWQGVPVGSVGAACATSFYPTKNLGAFGDGGAVLTADDDVARTCRSLRDYGQSARYEHELLGLNSRLDELHAAILRTALLPNLASYTERRRSVAQAYRDGIDNPKVRLVPAPAGSASVWHLFPVLVPAAQRESFCRHLGKERVSSAIHYPRLIVDQPALADVRFECKGEVERAREFAGCEVSLPIHPHLTNRELERVIAAVNRWEA
jgi:dTDP-3-amino-3,4,6-trideoxy-alpha-D-glucose transaminase